MTEDIASLTLKHLQEFRNEFGSFREEMRDDVRDIKTRLNHLEENSAMASRLDRMDERLIRIEKRLNLVDA